MKIIKYKQFNEQKVNTNSLEEDIQDNGLLFAKSTI